MTLSIHLLPMDLSRAGAVVWVRGPGSVVWTRRRQLPESRRGVELGF